MSTRAERDYMGRVASLSCACCGCCGPSQVHHIREGAGMGQRSPHFLTVPLCHFHHTGAGGVHGLGVREFERRYKLDELDLLSMTIRKLSEKI